MGKIKKKITKVLVVCLTLYLIMFSLYLILEPKRPVSEINLEKYFSVEKISTGKQYFNERVIISVVSFFYTLGLLLLLYKSKIGQDIFYKLTGKIDKIFIRTFIYTFTIVFIILGLLRLPVAFISHFHLKSYGIIHTPVWLFLKDYFIARAIIALGFSIILATGMWIYNVKRKAFPYASTIIVFVFALFITIIFPVFITPLFNDFKKLENGKVRQEINALLKKENIKADNIYVVDASKRTKGANAYVSGIGPTKEIVLYDVLLKDYKTNEVLSIVAHELGHYQRNHLWIGLLMYPLSNVFILFAFFFTLAYLMDWLREKNHDPAFHIPLVLIIIIVLMWAANPFINSVSRRMERDADITSLKMTDNPDAFISTEVKLSSKHRYFNYNPNWFYKVFFYTHPPVKKRIGMGVAYKKGLYEKNKRKKDNPQNQSGSQ